MKIVNAFSFNMIPAEVQAGTIRFKRLSPQEARALLEGGFVSAVGHAETARVASALLGLPVEANRATVTLNPGEALVLLQYRGPRLPEGSTALPEGATLEFYLVELEG